jgi:CheY-like chemotaxis protein
MTEALRFRFSPAPTIAVVDGNVWNVRRLSTLLQDRGGRVVLLTSSSNALQLLGAGRVDVVIFGESLDGPTRAELCTALVAKLDERRPFFVRFGTSRIPGEPSVFDAEASEAIEDAALIALVAKAVADRRAMIARAGVA